MYKNVFIILLTILVIVLMYAILVGGTITGGYVFSLCQQADEAIGLCYTATILLIVVVIGVVSLMSGILACIVHNILMASAVLGPSDRRTARRDDGRSPIDLHDAAPGYNTHPSELRYESGI